MQKNKRATTAQSLDIPDFAFRRLAEISPTGIYLTDVPGKCLYVNPAWCQMAGLTAEEAAGDGWLKAIHPDDRVRINSEWKLFITGVIPWSSEYRFVDHEGKITWVFGTASLFSEGMKVGVLGANLDITDRKVNEDKLKASEAEFRSLFAELHIHKDRLETLNSHLNDVRENERSNIAMNLHDDLGQRLTSLNLDLAWLKSRIGVQSQGVREKMEEMRRSIIETIESIKEVSSFLRPTILYELGLVSAFSWQLKKFHKQTGIKYLFSHEPDDFRIDDHISLIIYRVFQESITNVVRHSEASAVEVVLICTENLITLSIYDNGVGIDKDKIDSTKSLGIAGLRERVRSVGGTMLIIGNRGSGTRIKVSIPIKKKEEL